MRLPKPSIPVVIIVAAALALHLAVLGRYDFFRDELYFIVCGRHPAFGYVDQPPLIPLWAAFSQLWGENLTLLRLPAALAGVATAIVACLLTRLAGGGRFAQALTALTVAFAPMYVGLHYVLNTTVLEALCWTTIAYLVARAIVLDDRRALLWCGVIGGIGLEAKYSLAFGIVALVIGLACTPQRRILATREALIGTAIGIALAFPSFVWQGLHGWPIVEVLRNGAASKNIIPSPLVIIGQQALVMNVLAAPVWIAGALAPFVSPGLRAFRAFAIAFAIVCICMLTMHAKIYYFAAAYAAMFALGSVPIEAFVRTRTARLGYATAIAMVAAIAIPIGLPVMTPAQTLEYMTVLHVESPPQEHDQIGVRLPQDVVDQFGWRDLEGRVARVYRALPADDRANAAVLTDNYGEAAALGMYGRADGLPPILSGQNQFYIWGQHGGAPSVIIDVNGALDRANLHCRENERVGSFGGNGVMPVEHDRPIVICRGLERPLSVVWPRLKRFE